MREPLYDTASNTAFNVYKAFSTIINEKTTLWSSKSMLRIIRRKILASGNGGHSENENGVDDGFDYLSDTLSTRSSSSSSLSALKREQDLIDVFSEWGIMDNDDFDFDYAAISDVPDGNPDFLTKYNNGIGEVINEVEDESGSVCSNDDELTKEE